MKDMKFATVFPSYHPRKGDPTHFVEKIWTALMDYPDKKVSLFAVVHCEKLSEAHKNFHANEYKPKRTTIRVGHRWKKGDLFIPKIWTGKPYRSKPIAICEPLEVVDTEDFAVTYRDGTFINYYLNGEVLELADIIRIANIDGFDGVTDFNGWFSNGKGQTFEGQRIRFA